MRAEAKELAQVELRKNCWFMSESTEEATIFDRKRYESIGKNHYILGRFGQQTDGMFTREAGPLMWIPKDLLRQRKPEDYIVYLRSQETIGMFQKAYGRLNAGISGCDCYVSPGYIHI